MPISGARRAGGRARDRIFVGPAIGVIHNTPYEAEAYGIDRNTAREIGIERSLKTRRTLRKRGIRHRDRRRLRLLPWTP